MTTYRGPSDSVDNGESLASSSDVAASAAAAAASASAAATSETNAATSESNAATSESNASTSASNAATSESNASTSASNAATSETNAAASAASAAADLASFQAVYLGAQASDPGAGMTAGDLYFNTTTNQMKQYTGAAWINVVHPSIDDNGTATAITIDSSNNVGIGVTDLSASGANAKFAISGIMDIADGNAIAWGGGSGRTSISGSKASGTLTLSTPSTATGGSITLNAADSTANIIMKTNATERMRITNGGDVGVGLTSPQSTIHIHEATSGANYLQVTNTTTGSGSANGVIIGITSAEDVRLWNYHNSHMYFGNNNSEYMRLTSTGNLGLGTSSPTFTNINKGIEIEAASSAPGLRIDRSGTGAAQFEAFVDGSSQAHLRTTGAFNLVLGTNNTVRATVHATGNYTLFGKTASALGTSGVEIHGDGRGFYTANAVEIQSWNRLTSDGEIIKIYQDGTQEGNISVSGTTVSYNGGHLSRWTQLAEDDTTINIPRGTVMSSLDVMCDWYHLEDKVSGEKYPLERSELSQAERSLDDYSRGISKHVLATDNILSEDESTRVVREANEQLTRAKVSDVIGDRTVAGVFDHYDDDGDIVIAETGDFVIRVIGSVTNGDLLESNGDGTAKPQADDIVRSSTVAKALVTITQGAKEESLVPCLLI